MFRLPRRPLSLSTLLPATLVALVVAAVLPVIVVAYLFANDTAERLVAREREAVLDRIEAQLRQILDPVAAQVDYAAEHIAETDMALDTGSRVDGLMRGLLGGSKRVGGIGFIRPDGTMRRWERGVTRPIEEPANRLVLGRQVLDETRNGRSSWTVPFYSLLFEDVVVAYRAPLVKDGTFRGALTVAVTARDLAKYIGELSAELDLVAFVLVGRDRLLFYPRGDGSARPSPSSGLPAVGESSNAVVRAVWTDPRPISTGDDLRDAQGHWTDVDGVPHVYLHRELEGYGAQPFTVVVASPSLQTRWDRWSPTIAAGLGLLLMLLAAFGAWIIGRRVARPVIGIDEALDALGNLRYADVDVSELRRTGVLEWRRAAHRIEGTTAALSRLTRYVPRALTERLMRLSDPHTEPTMREVTVLILDLQGFTAFAAGNRPETVATTLAEAFGRIGPIIEAEGGVIDKYTGDGLLAFWGAPGEQPDHAARALAAVRRIRTAWANDPPDCPRIRIGLHTGESLVGDIGFEGRVDFTLIGEAAIVAHRTQGALRDIEPEARLVIGGSGEFTAALRRLGESPPWLHRIGEELRKAA